MFPMWFGGGVALGRWGAVIERHRPRSWNALFMADIKHVPNDARVDLSRRRIRPLAARMNAAQWFRVSVRVN